MIAAAFRLDLLTSRAYHTRPENQAKDFEKVYISFNYLNTSQENCQLNNENMNTNSSGLKLIKGSRYYDLVVNYNLEVGNYWDNYSTISN